MTQVVGEKYIAGFDAHKKLWCEQSLIVYEKLYSENFIIDMHNNSRVLNIELYCKKKVEITLSENTQQR